MPPTTRPRLPKPAKEVAAQAGTPRKQTAAAQPPKKTLLVDSTAAKEESPTKRRKVSTKEPKPSPPVRPPIDLSKTHYKPSMLPVEPNFSVQAAMDHLCQFDPRFKGIFEAMKCRPFDYNGPFEALDPYRTLTTSIVGQQVRLAWCGGEMC